MFFQMGLPVSSKMTTNPVKCLQEKHFPMYKSASPRLNLRVVVALLAFAGLVNTLQAQNGGCNSNSGCTANSVDPGPRPTGNQVVNFNGVKFNNVVPNSVQPSDGVNAGAGNVLANTAVGSGSNQVRFGPFWGQAVAVLEPQRP